MTAYINPNSGSSKFVKQNSSSENQCIVRVESEEQRMARVTQAIGTKLAMEQAKKLHDETRKEKEEARKQREAGTHLFYLALALRSLGSVGHSSFRS